MNLNTGLSRKHLIKVPRKKILITAAILLIAIAAVIGINNSKSKNSRGANLQPTTAVAKKEI